MREISGRWLTPAIIYRHGPDPSVGGVGRTLTFYGRLVEVAAASFATVVTGILLLAQWVWRAGGARLVTAAVRSTLPPIWRFTTAD